MPLPSLVTMEFVILLIPQESTWWKDDLQRFCVVLDIGGRQEAPSEVSCTLGVPPLSHLDWYLALSHAFQHWVLVPLHGFGWRWHHISVWDGVFLWRTSTEDGVPGYRDPSLWGLCLPGINMDMIAFELSSAAHLLRYFDSDAGHGEASNSRSDHADGPQGLPNDSCLFRHILQLRQISGTWTERSICQH